jgi:hypothetical protein
MSAANVAGRVVGADDKAEAYAGAVDPAIGLETGPVGILTRGVPPLVKTDIPFEYGHRLKVAVCHRVSRGPVTRGYHSE